MFPHSSIKRLRFAFVAMAGLTLSALVVGCITFAYSYMTQKRFFADATPLLVNVEQLSNVVIRFSATARQLETVNTRGRLNRILAKYQSENEALQQGLLDLVRHGPDEQTVKALNNVVHELETIEAPYAEALRAKIDAGVDLAALQQEIDDEGQALLDRLPPLVLQSSLEVIDLVQQNRSDQSDPNALVEAVNEVQLFTEISFAAERFLHTVGRYGISTAGPASLTLRETLAPEFRRLTQLALKLRDQGTRQAVAGSLHAFNKKTLESDGITDQWQRLLDAAAKIDSLRQQRTLLLTRMTGLVERIVTDAREIFFESADVVERSSLIAVSVLATLSTTAFAAVVWIGWRLINRDIAQRLERLTISTVALAGGDLDVEIDQSGSDELADMAQAAEIFRQNARELRQAEAELADRLVEVEGTNKKLLLVNTTLDAVNAELAESDLRYELAVRGSSVGIWDWNAKTDVFFWSDRLKQIVGLTDQALKPELSSFTDRLHPDDHDLVVEQRRLHLEKGNDYDVDCRLRREDGSYVWVHNRGQAIWDKTGNLVRMAGSATDISDRKSAEIKLNQYARELERSNQELDDFAYIASHDLKEPLRAMYNHATFLIEDFQGKLGEDGEKRLHRMIKLGKRMEKLIADLLYFSRLGRGEQATELIDLNRVIADIEVNLAETLKERNARITVPEHLPSICGHPAQMTALFQNLISNGVKYSDAEEKIIEIGLIPTVHESDTHPFETLYVRDNGIGIDEQFRDEIFRIFKRLNSEKAYGEGTGAGLTFVKKIVENHGGRIWIKSEAGKGASFFLTLPTKTTELGIEAGHVAA